MKSPVRLNLFVLSVLLFSVSSVYSQQPRSEHGSHAVDTTGVVAKTETSPGDDAILEFAPTNLSLDFPERVRLVKLTVRNEKRDWVDISFRYNPGARESYSWDLPKLEPAVYYTADWAILGANEQLIKGNFSFAFGPEAEHPSVIKEAEDLALRIRESGSDAQYVTPPRTEIIIDQDPREYDPPFTIDLQLEDDC